MSLFMIKTKENRTACIETLHFIMLRHVELISNLDETPSSIYFSIYMSGKSNSFVWSRPFKDDAVKTYGDLITQLGLL